MTMSVTDGSTYQVWTVVGDEVRAVTTVGVSQGMAEAMSVLFQAEHPDVLFVVSAAKPTLWSPAAMRKRIPVHAFGTK